MRALWLSLALGFSLLGASPASQPEKAPPDPPRLERIAGLGIPQGVVIRTSENVTKGGWIYVLNRCEALGIRRIDLLVKQDEDHFQSPRNGDTLQSGDLLVPLPGEQTAKGWEDASWLREMFTAAKQRGIEIWAWWPCFHDADAAARFPAAAYSSSRDERFVDPADPRVRERQEQLLEKLLDTYPFSGVSLDWLRYEGWQSGSKGPLGQRFARAYQFQWGPEALDSEYRKARWYELRARTIADWVSRLVSDMRMKRPEVRWGAFLLPWQFSEVSQSYPMLGRTGLDYLQPMCYWRDWKKEPEWVGQRALELHREISNGAAQWATLGIDAPVEEIDRAVKSIANGSIAGLSWFTYGTWEEKTFRRVREVVTHDTRNREFFGLTPPPKPPENQPESLRWVWEDEARSFPGGSSVWSVVTLAELYRRNALPDDERIVPILAFHVFIDGKKGEHHYTWGTSTEYLDELLDFIGRSGFNVTPLSRFQSYLITGDPSFLPKRPLVITVDDGHASVVPYFIPRAKARSYPFAIAAITSQLDGASEGKKNDAFDWDAAKAILNTGLAEFISHSDGMHYLTSETPWISTDNPAETSRQYLTELYRRETTREYLHRIRLDMTTSRQKLSAHGFGAPTIFCWPYGHSNAAATAIARESGFTHFLNYKTPPVLATWHSSRDGVPRIAIQLQDESVPLAFPTDPRIQQAWWLAFLRVAIDSRSIPLIRATLAQLSAENLHHPEADLALAAIDFIRGDAASGGAQLERFRDRFEGEEAFIQRSWKLLWEYDSSPK